VYEYVFSRLIVGNKTKSFGFIETQGKYHQVKRMLAAVSNRVEGLHRSRIGSLTLADLPAGQWRWLTADEVKAVSAKA